MGRLVDRLSGTAILFLAAVVLLSGSFGERSLYASESANEPVKEEKAVAPESKPETAVQDRGKNNRAG